jgi:hypothetical protein
MQENNLTYSELTYLNADKYVPEASLLQNKEELPTQKKVNISKLGNLLSEVAFAYLYFNGHIELKLETKKVLGLFPKKIVISSKKSDGAGLTSLEKSVFSLSDNLEASTLLYRLIGEESTVPWAVITGIVKGSLVNKEFLTKEEITKKVIISYVTFKYHLNPSKNVVLTDNITEMNNKMKEFSQKDFYKQLVKSIDSGIRAQIERSDSSD